MGTWQTIFKKEGRVFIQPHEDFGKIVRLLKKHKVKRILDLGCGTGRHTIALVKEGFDVYATDISKEGLRLTKNWLKEERLKAKTTHSSCYKKFPFQDNYFDAVISVQVIHHNYHDKILFCIKEIERVLKNDGIAFITMAASIKFFYKSIKKVEDRTFIPQKGAEKGLPHFIYNKKLIKKDFNHFNLLDVYIDSRNHYCVLGKVKK